MGMNGRIYVVPTARICIAIDRRSGSDIVCTGMYRHSENHYANMLME